MSLLTIIILLFVVAIVVVAVILILSLTRMQQRKLVKSFAVEVANRGNARSRYELWADDPSHELTFEFSLNGAKLGQPQAATAGGAVGQNLLASNSRQSPVRSGQSVKAAALNASDKVSGFGLFIGGILDTLGHLLPGGAGASLLSMSYRMRGAQATVDRTQRVGAQAQAMVSGRQAGSPLSGIDDRMPNGPNTSNPMIASDGTVGASGGIVTRPQTAPVDPGKQLQLNLIARPVSRLKSEQVPFKVYSQSLEVQDVEPLAQDAVAYFKGMTGIMFYLPQIIVAAVALVLAIVLLAVTRVLG